MCEYCGCQAIPAIKQLTQEHDEIIDLVGEVRSAHRRGDVARMILLSGRIDSALVPHTMVEEQALFPAMAGDFPEQIAILEDEHRRIEQVLAEAHDGQPSASWPQRLIDLLALLREHILKEQDGVFPAALSILNGEEWDRLDAVRAGAGAVTP